MDIVLDILRDLAPEIEVRAFGSRVAWSARETSDLDLALMTDEQLPTSRMADLREAFSESDLPFKVDLLDWASVAENFRKIIEREYVVVQVGGARCGEIKGQQNLRFNEAVSINPTIRLDRGEIYPFVNMAAVSASSRWVSGGEIRKYSGGGTKFQSGDTLMARITPCLENGKIARYQATGTLKTAHGSTEFIVIRGRPNVTDTEFAYYLTRSEKVRSYAISQMTGTSGRQRVPTNSLNNLTVSIPSLPEQRTIAHILGTLDDKIELNRQMNETLEAIARTLFKSWFVDFDPVRAKMEGHQPAGISPELAALFPDSFEDSELGEIPKGWSATTLGQVIEILDSKRIPLSRRQRSEQQGPYPYYGAASVMDYVNDYLFDGIYLLVGEDGSVVNDDSSPVLQYVWGKFWVNNHAHVLLGKKSITPEFLYLHLRQSNINAYVTGAVQPKLNQGNMKKIAFILPNEPICVAFNQIIESLFARFRTSMNESRFLSDLRDTLLPKLISGESRIKNIQKSVELMT